MLPTVQKNNSLALFSLFIRGLRYRNQQYGGKYDHLLMLKIKYFSKDNFRASSNVVKPSGSDFHFLFFILLLVNTDEQLTRFLSVSVETVETTTVGLVLFCGCYWSTPGYWFVE